MASVTRTPRALRWPPQPPTTSPAAGEARERNHARCSETRAPAKHFTTPPTTNGKEREEGDVRGGRRVPGNDGGRRRGDRARGGGCCFARPRRVACLPAGTCGVLVGLGCLCNPSGLSRTCGATGRGEWEWDAVMPRRVCIRTPAALYRRSGLSWSGGPRF